MYTFKNVWNKNTKIRKKWKNLERYKLSDFSVFSVFSWIFCFFFQTFLNEWIKKNTTHVPNVFSYFYSLQSIFVHYIRKAL